MDTQRFAFFAVFAVKDSHDDRGIGWP